MAKSTKKSAKKAIKKAVAKKPVKVIPEDSGNKHAIAKRRDLTDQEKAIVKTAFVKANGIISNDDSLKILQSLGKGLSSFQVVGAINGFHRQVRKGVIKLRDMKTYTTHMEARRALWASYKSDRYKEFAKKLRITKAKATRAAKKAAA